MSRIRIFWQVSGTQKAESYQHLKTVHVVDNQDQMGMTTPAIRWVRIPNFDRSDHTALELVDRIVGDSGYQVVVYVNDTYFESDPSGWQHLPPTEENMDLFRGLYRLAVKAEGGAAL